MIAGLALEVSSAAGLAGRARFFIAKKRLDVGHRTAKIDISLPM